MYSRTCICDKKFSVDFLHVLDHKLTDCRNRYIIVKKDKIIYEAMQWVWLCNGFWYTDSGRSCWHPESLIEMSLLDPSDVRCWKKVQRLMNYFCDLFFADSYVVDDISKGVE